VSPAARDYLAQKGYDPMNGARPLARLIHEEVKRPLTDELLFGALASGGSVSVELEGDKLVFTYAPPPPKAAAS
jgi:ATP-dependent Clp protease ATP-binding subunit ClpA